MLECFSCLTSNYFFRAKEDTLSKTKMLDYYKEVLEQQNEPPANYEAEIEARKEEVIKELKEKKEPMQVNY